MKNEFELTIKYFDKRAIATRRELWNKIVDLQSQLQQANEIINNPDTLIFQQQELIDNLQSQLAEKDKEIEISKSTIDFYKSYYISFKEKVIDELEKVKEEIGNEIDTFIDIYENRCVKTDDLEFFINNQIKQLKENNV